MDNSKGNQTELTYGCGSGYASVNVYTGRMQFEYPLFTIGGNSFQIATSLIYNAYAKANDFGTKIIGLGNGWKFNIQQYVFPYIEAYHMEDFVVGDYVYIDSNSAIHRFVKYKEKDIENKHVNVYYDTIGSGLRLQVGLQYGIEIYDQHHNVLKFNQDGKITEMISCIHHNIKKKIEYDGNGNLASIYDTRKPERSIKFSYNTNHQLTTLSINQTQYEYNFVYQSDKLVKLCKRVCSLEKDVMYFRYTGTDLCEVIDAKSLETLKFTNMFDGKTKETRLYRIDIGVAAKRLKIEGVESAIFTGENAYLEPSRYISNQSKALAGEELEITYNKTHTIFTYQKGYTDCQNEKNITIRYYFNHKGITTSVFEVKSEYYYSLFKPQGWSLFEGGMGDTVINGKRSIKINSTNYLLQLENGINFESALGGSNSQYKEIEDFELSFWVKCSKTIEQDIKIWVLYDVFTDKTCEVILDKTEKDVWQYVTIPIQFIGDKDEIKSYSIFFYGIPAGQTLEIADVRIKQDESTTIKIYSENKEFLFGKQREKILTKEEYARKLSIVYTIDGVEFNNYITSNFFMTDSDVYQTYKNIYNKQNSNDTFDLICCNGTKAIEVDKVKIRMDATQFDNQEDIEFVVEEGVPNYYNSSVSRIDSSTYRIVEILHRFHQDSNQNQIYYETSIYKEMSQSPMRIYDWARFKQTFYYNEDGRYREIQDGNNLITKYNYDIYGNINSVRTYKEGNLTDYLETKYIYNQIEERLRELPTCIQENGIEQSYEYTEPFINPTCFCIGDYKQKLKYDDFEEKIITIKNIDANTSSNTNNNDIIKNEIEYDIYGRVKAYKDEKDIVHSFLYNAFGEPTQYYYNGKLMQSSILRRGETEDIQTSIQYTSLGANEVTTTFDKYGRIETQNRKEHTIEYTYDDYRKESLYISPIKKIKDPYEEKEYIYDMDEVKQKSTVSNGTLTIVNEKNKSIEYHFKDDPQYLVQTMTIESTKVDNESSIYPIFVEPKLKNTKYEMVDKNCNNDVIEYCNEFNFTYAYDHLGRLAKKTGEICNIGIYAEKVFKYKTGTTKLSEVNYNIYSGFDCASFSYRNETYDNKGNIKKVREDGTRYIENPVSDENKTKADLFNKEHIYTYDPFNRLIREEDNIYGNAWENKNTNLSSEIEYIYDDSNMLSAVKKDGKKIKDFQNEKGRLKEFTIEEKQKSRMFKMTDTPIVTNTYEIQYDYSGNTKEIKNKDPNNKYGNLVIEYNDQNLVKQFSYYDYMFDSRPDQLEWKLIPFKQECYYNHQGKRYRKKIKYQEMDQDIVYKDIQYYFDKDRIIGEDYLDENGIVKTQIRYFYDIEGISGMSYKGYNFNFIKDSLGNISKVMYRGKMIGEYIYDAWGNCEVKELSIDTNEEIGEREQFVLYHNPFRYKGYYYDVETNLFFVTSRYYSPELGRFIQPADVSSLNPSSINGLNLYSYANNNPIGIAYSSSSTGGSTRGGLINVIGSPMVNSIINNSSYNNYVDLNFLGNFFAFNENIYSSIAGVFEGIRRRQGLGQYESLAKASKILMHVGYWLNIGLSAYNNYHDSSLTAHEKWVSFGVDTVYTTGVTIGAFYLGMIPYAGPFLAILVPVAVEYLWSGELSIFGFDFDVQPIKIKGKTIEEWVKEWVNSWFE